MKVKFSRCNSGKLSSVPLVDGQMTYIKDTSEIYIDIKNKRNKVTDIIFLQTLLERDNIENPISNKLYYVEEDNTLYHYNKVNSVWEMPKIATTAEVSEFNPENTELESTTVQDAVVELDTKLGDVSALLDKLNGTTDYTKPEEGEEVI